MSVMKCARNKTTCARSVELFVDVHVVKRHAIVDVLCRPVVNVVIGVHIVVLFVPLVIVHFVVLILLVAILYQFIPLFSRSHFSPMFSLYSHGILDVVFTRARCKTKGKTRRSDAGCTKFGDLATADQRILGVENESKCGHRHAPDVRDHYTSWMHSYPMKTERHIGNNCLMTEMRFLSPKNKPGRIFTDDSMHFKMCSTTKNVGKSDFIPVECFKTERVDVFFMREVTHDVLLTSR